MPCHVRSLCPGWCALVAALTFAAFATAAEVPVRSCSLMPLPTRDRLDAWKRYQQLTNDAVREVLRNVLLDLVRSGRTDAPSDPSAAPALFITVDTRDPDARLPDELRDLWRDGITFVLQYDYRDLVVGADSFEVTLRFGGNPERVRIPFAAVTAFVDSNVGFCYFFRINAVP
jgi:hypothetical protein